MVTVDDTTKVQSTITQSRDIDNSRKRLTEWLGHLRKLDEQVREEVEEQKKLIAEALRSD